MPKLAKSKQKGFTLVELLVTIAIIGLLSTIVLVTFGGHREKALTARGQLNQANVKGYCAANPGESELNGDTVYCDDKFVMWSTTLEESEGDYDYEWKLTETALPPYAEGDCNNLTLEDMEEYPACYACATLDYAGYSEGWRLPSQGDIPPGGTTCNIACGRDDVYCAPGRQLWDFGKEQCPRWGTLSCDGGQGACAYPDYITWDSNAAATNYWSSTQGSAAGAWLVNFASAYASYHSKSGSWRVRCYLGQYW